MKLVLDRRKEEEVDVIEHARALYAKHFGTPRSKGHTPRFDKGVAKSTQQPCTEAGHIR